MKEQEWLELMHVGHIEISINQQQTQIHFEGEYDEGGIWEFTFNVAFQVCGRCEGRGTIVNPSVEMPGGGFTSSEWQEVCHEDPDFPEDYFGGVYDIACPECNSQRVKPWVDEARHRDDADWQKVNKMLDEAWKDEATYQAEVAAERRFGA